MTLTEYIKQVGLLAFCKQFGVEERTATSWLYKARRPRPDVAVRIIANTEVTWEGIYPPKAKKTRKSRVSAEASA